jgi:hypothetical protein
MMIEIIKNNNDNEWTRINDVTKKMKQSKKERKKM